MQLTRRCTERQFRFALLPPVSLVVHPTAGGRVNGAARNLGTPRARGAVLCGVMWPCW